MKPRHKQPSFALFLVIHQHSNTRAPQKVSIILEKNLGFSALLSLDRDVLDDGGFDAFWIAIREREFVRAG